MDSDIHLEDNTNQRLNGNTKSKLQSDHQEELSTSIKDLLKKCDFEEHREKLVANGYESMRTLRLASKDDLVACGLPRGHAGLVAHIVDQDTRCIYVLVYE